MGPWFSLTLLPYQPVLIPGGGGGVRKPRGHCFSHLPLGGEGSGGSVTDWVPEAWEAQAAHPSGQGGPVGARVGSGPHRAAIWARGSQAVLP